MERRRRRRRRHHGRKLNHINLSNDLYLSLIFLPSTLGWNECFYAIYHKQKLFPNDDMARPVLRIFAYKTSLSFYTSVLYIVYASSDARAFMNIPSSPFSIFETITLAQLVFGEGVVWPEVV